MRLPISLGGLISLEPDPFPSRPWPGDPSFAAGGRSKSTLHIQICGVLVFQHYWNGSGHDTAADRKRANRIPTTFASARSRSWSRRPMSSASIPVQPRCQTTYAARQAIRRVLHGADDDRLLVVIGPCSIHDYDLAMDYAKKLAKEAERFAEDLIVVVGAVRNHRTTVGWKGLIRRSAPRQRLAASTRACASPAHPARNRRTRPALRHQFLDTITPQYTADLIAWGAVGADDRVAGASRTHGSVVPVQLQRHRWQHAHCGRTPLVQPTRHTISCGDKSGHTAMVSPWATRTLPRYPAWRQTNYDAASVDAACAEIARSASLPVDGRFLAWQQQAVRLQWRFATASPSESPAAKTASWASWSSRIWLRRPSGFVTGQAAYLWSSLQRLYQLGDSVAVMEKLAAAVGRAVWPRQPNNQKGWQGDN